MPNFHTSRTCSSHVSRPALSKPMLSRDVMPQTLTLDNHNTKPVK